MQTAVDGRCGAGFASGEAPASLEDGITYDQPSSGNGTSSGPDGGDGAGGSGSDGGFDEGSTGFRVQALVHSAVLLASVALLAMLSL